MSTTSHSCTCKDCGLEFSETIAQEIQKHDEGLREELEKEWDARKSTYINNIIRSWYKHFHEKSQICPDCGGPAWHVCERNIRDLVGVIVEAARREVQFHLTNNK